ncbi:hypothetical protein FF100_13470 [Methylobacterium terricola]|uniref:Uncharacterized protein n=1 Tax=Methylobacterium terricola TaxID=2583531 RepID=A0A5C4LFB4_9HYPH|nr:hypothetical protein [Methylobacterium terricola]TNC12682.1 hypothetical protein FF100_13470 [Methylobacterium terricola]
MNQINTCDLARDTRNRESRRKPVALRIREIEMHKSRFPLLLDRYPADEIPVTLEGPHGVECGGLPDGCRAAALRHFPTLGTSRLNGCSSPTSCHCIKWSIL